MPLSTHLKQGRLLYFTRSPDAISVIENDYLRWLTFDDVIQSIMNKHHPYRLTLPHHLALLQPLKTVIPDQIIEFGLGGGTMARFIGHYLPHATHKIIESNKQVIKCFNQFFDDGKSHADVIHTSAEQWASPEQLMTYQSAWIIYDIYQHQEAHISIQTKLLYSLINQLSDQHVLSINIPFSTAPERAKLIALCHLKMSTHLFNMYTVPHYQNWIFHLTPIHFNTNVHQADKNQTFYLSTY